MSSYYSEITVFPGTLVLLHGTALLAGNWQTIVLLSLLYYSEDIHRHSSDAL